MKERAYVVLKSQISFNSAENGLKIDKKLHFLVNSLKYVKCGGPVSYGPCNSLYFKYPH